MSKKYTKAQAKRALKSIQSKAAKLFLEDKGVNNSDYVAIEKIVMKALNRLK